jgi:hypothetical protein
LQWELTWCILRTISDPPINSPLMKTCGNVGQWLQKKNIGETSQMYICLICQLFIKLLKRKSNYTWPLARTCTSSTTNVWISNNKTTQLFHFKCKEKKVSKSFYISRQTHAHMSTTYKDIFSLTNSQKI